MTISYTAIHDAIGQWYVLHGRRDLPWRNSDDAYQIYLSEIMLQQTQVKTVLERFYFPFLEQFPTLKALGEADLQAVLKMWEGLGYYNRARNLHKTAQVTGGVLPDSVDALKALPGIGQNTAHAVAAFAFGQAVPVMEANLKRVLCRFFALEAKNDKQLWVKADELLDKANPFDYNQAMMDIGAMICTPKNPQCGDCPLNNMCQGKNDPQRYPLKVKKKAVPVRQRSIFIWRNEQMEIYMTQRKGRFLHGMHCFDEHEIPPAKLTAQAQKKGQVSHTYSHFTLNAEVYVFDTPTAMPPKGGSWYSLEQVKQLPLSGADKKVLALLT